MGLIWLVEELMLRCPVTSTGNGIQRESRTHLTPTFPLLHVGSWPRFSHGHYLWAGLVLNWLITFLPSCVLIVTKPSGIFLLPPTQHSVFLFCGSITDSKGLGNPSGGFITWNRMLWSMVKTTLAHKIDQCGLLYYVLRKKNTRNQAKWCQVLMLWLSKVQVHVRDCLITQGTVL